MAVTTGARRTRGATITDVAKYAGVSAMTVSRVINDGAGVRDATRQAVIEAIRALHYTPNVAARSLVTAREVRIGIIYSNPSAGFMSEFLIGIFEEASSHGAQLLLLRGEHGRAPPAAATEHLVASGVSGVIMAPPLGEAEAVQQVLRAAGVPMAVVGGVAAGAVSVRIDDRCAAYDMTRHLLALGHRRIGFVTGNPDQSASAERLSGFHAAVSDVAGIETVIAQGDFTYASGLVAGEQLLSAPNPPTAIFASNDDMAAAVVSVAHRRHLDVPGDLTVVGFDDTTAAITLWPPLTTVHQPVRELAAQALHLLMREIQNHGGERHPGADRVLDHVLIERQSTAAPAARAD